MIGNEGETMETIKETAKLLLSLPLDYVQISPVFYPPNTTAYTKLVATIEEDYWKKYTIDPAYRRDLPIIGTQFKKEEIDLIAKKLYLRFYLRPLYVLRSVGRLRSFREVKRYAQAIIKMICEVLVHK